MEGSPKRKLKYQHALADVLGFTEDDLLANEQGHITDAQTGRLRGRWLELIPLVVFIVVALAIITPITSFVFRPMPFGGSSFSGWFFMIAGLIFLFAVGSSVWKAFNVFRDLQERRVESVEGTVSLDIENRRGSYQAGGVSFRTNSSRMEYALYIGGERFKVNKRTFLAFKNGDPYVVYYAPHSKTILSADWLRDDPFE